MRESAITRLGDRTLSHFFIIGNFNFFKIMQLF